MQLSTHLAAARIIAIAELRMHELYGSVLCIPAEKHSFTHAADTVKHILQTSSLYDGAQTVPDRIKNELCKGECSICFFSTCSN